MARTRSLLAAGVGGSIALAIALGWSGTVPLATTTVTYAADVAPILYGSCAGCHRPGGSAPFSLLTYQDARSRADRIARATSRRAMPPWLPSGEAVFVGERRLSDAQIETLVRWAEAGAPEGDLAMAPAPPESPGPWPLGTPDLVLPVPRYSLPAEGRDVYRNLVVPIPLTETRWVEAVELSPGNRKVVHHARMMVDTSGTSRALDREDEAPGFDGMELRSAATNPDGHFVGWTPGKVSLPPRAGLAWRVDPGTDLVLQLHLRTTGQEEEVDAEVGLYFADRPPDRSPVILIVSSLMIDLPPGVRDHHVTNSYTLPVDVEVLSVYPHAHYLGRHLRGVAHLPDGGTRQLIDIPAWDFNWQDEYRYREPLALPAGTVISMDFSFDNSPENAHNPSDPPVRVRYGSTSNDEMADLILQVLPRRAADRARLVSDQAWTIESENMAYMAYTAFDAGSNQLAEGRLDQAIRQFQEALQYRSDHVGALLGLSAAFARKGDGPSSLVIAGQAVSLTGRRNAGALDALAAAHYVAGESEQAVLVAREALGIATAGGEQVLADSIRARIDRYRGGR